MKVHQIQQKTPVETKFQRGQVGLFAICDMAKRITVDVFAQSLSDQLIVGQPSCSAGLKWQRR